MTPFIGNLEYAVPGTQRLARRELVTRPGPPIVIHL
jgi:hypothetical protein